MSSTGKWVRIYYKTVRGPFFLFPRRRTFEWRGKTFVVWKWLGWATHLQWRGNK